MINHQDFSKMKLKNTYTISFLILLLATSVSGFSQSLKKANRLYENRSYVNAAEIYEKLNKTPEVLQKLGDCYYYNSEIKKANDAYSEAFDNSDKSKLSTQFFFNYFDVLRSTEEYEKSDSISAKYLDNPIYTKVFRIKLKNIVPFTYTLENLTEQSNSASFGVGLYGEKIVFSSTRNPESPEYHWNNKPYLDLFEAIVKKDEKKSLDSINAFAESINNKTLHESSAAFTKDGNTIYFSRNHKKRVEVDSNKVAMVSIYKAEKINDDWKNIERVSFASDYYSTMHPSLNEAEDRLYFASDMPTSLGGFDIFYVDILEDRSFGEPTNMGATINTKYREQFPFMAKDSTIYFASNGKHGFGGLDLFSSKKTNIGYLEALNLGETINSPKDDFAFLVIDSLNTGYLSSNRDGIDNIYSFMRMPTDRKYYVEGLVTDKTTGRPLPNTIVTLFDEDGNIIDELVVGEDARYKLATLPNQHYQIEGFKPKYIPELEFFDTNDKGNIEFNIALEIESYDDAEEIILGRDDGNVYIELENIYFDFAKWDIKPQAAKTLDVLVELLKKYPRMEIQLGAHTDSRATAEFNMDLSQKRAASTLEYLVDNGIKRTRLISKGFGETRPIIACGENCTESEHSINRRCEFVILK